MIQVQTENKKGIKVYINGLYDFECIPKGMLDLIIYMLEESLSEIKRED